MRYLVYGQLATLNEHDAANRSNRYVGAALKKDMTDLVAWQLKGKDKIKLPCTLSFEWYFSGKHDLDNVAFSKKYVLDGMVKAGILKNDNQRWVLGFTDSFIKVKPGDEKVIIETEEFIE